MIALILFVLGILASPFKAKSRLEAENAALRQQLIVLQRKKESAQAGEHRPLVSRPALPMVPVDPGGPHHHPSGDVGALA
jgi:hypothetical protein